MATKNDQNFIAFCDEVRTYVEEHHHFPNKHTAALNRIKYIRKKINEGTLEEWKRVMFMEIADKLEGDDRDVLKLRPGITGPATLKYRLEDEMISEYVAKRQAEGDTRPMQEIATEYNDNVIYPDKVRLNCYYYHHYSFWKDIEMIIATVLGRKISFAGERF